MRRLLGGTLAEELLSLFVGDDRSTSPRLPEVLSALTGFSGVAVLNRTTVRAAGPQPPAAYDAFIVSS